MEATSCAFGSFTECTVLQIPSFVLRFPKDSWLGHRISGCRDFWWPGNSFPEHKSLDCNGREAAIRIRSAVSQNCLQHLQMYSPLRQGSPPAPVRVSSRAAVWGCNVYRGWA